MSPSQQRSVVSVALVTILVGGLLGLFGSITGCRRSPTAEPAPQAPKTHVAPEQLARGSWWRDPAVASELSLREDQQERLDQLLGDFLVRHRQLAERAAQLDAEVDAALVTGDLDAFSKLGAERAQVRGDQVVVQPQWIVTALAVLDAKQLQQLSQTRPHLLHSQWYRELPLGRKKR